MKISKSNIINVIIEKIKEVKDKEINEDNFDCKFPDLEIDSIDYVEIMLGVEEELKVDLLSKEIDWSKISTINILSDLLHEELKNKENN